MIDFLLIACVLLAPIVPAVHIGRLYLSVDIGAPPGGPPDLMSMSTQQMQNLACLIIGAAAIWWVVLGSILALWPGCVRAILQPFGEWFTRKHAIILIGIGVVAAGALLALRRPAPEPEGGGGRGFSLDWPMGWGGEVSA